MENSDSINKFYSNYFKSIKAIAEKLEYNSIEDLVNEILNLRKNKGRLFFLGVGGSAGNCSHAVNDFRKLCSINSYSITDNVSELTARINDEGWDSSFSEWLKISNLSSNDAIFILSVGGGSEVKKVSGNIIEAIKFAKICKSKIFGIVGRDGGFTMNHGDNVILIPDVESSMVTPLTESYQAVVWHCIVSHPKLKVNETKW